MLSDPLLGSSTNHHMVNQRAFIEEPYRNQGCCPPGPLPGISLTIGRWPVGALKVSFSDKLKYFRTIIIFSPLRAPHYMFHYNKVTQWVFALWRHHKVYKYQNWLSKLLQFHNPTCQTQINYELTVKKKLKRIKLRKNRRKIDE